MIRGTTPTLVYTLPFETSVIDKIWITFSQNGKEVYTIDEHRCNFNNKTVTVTLTQEETLQFTPNCYVDMQIRILTKSNSSLASFVIKKAVHNILKGGVMK